MFKSFDKLNNLFNLINNKLTKSSVAHTKTVLLKADTGASRHYLQTIDTNILENVHQNTNAIKVHLRNNEVLESNRTGLIPFSGLSTSAKEEQILPSLMNKSLLSFGQLCNDNCVAIFTKTDMIILKQG